MRNESLMGAVIFSVLLATSRAQDGREGGGVVSAKEPVANSTAADFFVSPQGHDSWSGRLAEPRENDGPFATVKRAQEAVQASLKTQSEPRLVRVVLRGGTYFLDGKKV